VQSYLGRPWRNYARTVFLHTEMSGAVRPEGWNNWGKTAAEKTVRYAEFGSTGPGGAPAARAGWSTQLTAEEAALLAPEKVLAGGDQWRPSVAVRTVP